MTLQDDLINAVNQQFPNNPVSSILSQIISISVSFAYVIGIIFAVVIVVRFARRYSMFAGKGTPYGPYSVHWIGGDGYAHGNLSKNESFEQENFDKIKIQAPEWNMNFEEFSNLVESKQLCIYDFKVTDHSKVWSFKNTEDVIIISNGEMDSNDFSVAEKNGRFSFTSATFKETARTVGAFATSRHFPIEDGYGKTKDVWMLNLIPQKPLKVMNDVMTGDQYQVIVKTVGNMEALAKSVVLLPALIRLQDENNKIKAEADDYRRLLLQSYDKNKGLNALFNKGNHFLTQKVFVGNNRPLTPLQRVSEIAFIFAAFLIPLGAFRYLPTAYPSIDPTLVSFVVFIIIMVMREIWKKQQKKDDDLGITDQSGMTAAQQ